ncbi:protease [Diplodia corticola]|uniref:Protease n=1 Tax=Diplodia corticola TaxID=236234 RepID=A0A1J9S8G1_9PEZI|nr:protease [Diplodia corticola]OJD35869.1 protease [Diplodia corticola]
MFLRPGLFRAVRMPPAKAQLYAASARRFYSSFQSAGQASSERLLYGALGLNTAVFVAWKYADRTIPFEIKSEQIDLSKARVLQALSTNFFFKDEDLHTGRWWTAITHAFSHASIPHFIFNMVALKTFGDAVISFLPGIRPLSFATLYLGAAIAGSVGWSAQRKQSESPRQVAGAAGASGAISGLAATAALIAPNARWQLMFIPIGIPAWAIFSAYIAYSAFYMNDPNSGIGHSSHLGGAAFGAVYYLLVLRRLRFPFRR